MSLRRWTVGLLALLVLPLEARAGSSWSVGVSVPPSRQVSMDRISHQLWDQLLHKYVDTQGNVDYAAWKRSAQDMQALNRYLNTLSYASVSKQASRAARMAFWINAYNAVTVRGILREYPTSSIRNHTARLFGYNIWKDLYLIVGGSRYNLEQIEHQVLRKMGDPRIHFAIVCASRGCPRLRNEAYTAARLESQLEDNAREFFARPHRFRYRNGTFYLSPILKWFAEDFGGSQAAVLRSIARYLPSAAARQAAQRGQGTVVYLDYDWSLNDRRGNRR